MKITWVNHASAILQSGSVRLICDPWTRGTAFNDGWHLLSPTRDPERAFEGVTHIWISHEHPDHFSIPTLKGVPDAIKRTAVVLFQKTRDRRVRDFCAKLGFRNIEELPLLQPIRLSEDVRVTVGPHRHMDSWLLFEAPGARLLNINDCSITSPSQAARVKHDTGTVDVLMTQFSYAQWVGNPEELARRRRMAKKQLAFIELQVRAFQPRAVIPFASFVRFNHRENLHMNEGANSARAAAECIRKAGALPVVLYPGDSWSVGSVHDSEPALAAYERDARQFAVPVVESHRVPLETLAEHAIQYRQRVKAKNWWTGVRALYGLGYIRTSTIYLRDLDLAVSYDLPTGLRRSQLGSAECDVVMSSDSLDFAFTQDFGAETLYVNGRFLNQTARSRNIFRHFYFSILNNQGFSFPIGAADFLFQDKVRWRLALLKDAVAARRYK